MRQPSTKPAARRDMSGLGKMSVPLNAMFVFALVAVLLATMSESYPPVAAAMWYPALGLLILAVSTETLWCTSRLHSERLLTWLHCIAIFAIPVVLAIAVAMHGEFLKEKTAVVACLDARSAGIEEATRLQAGARTVLKRCQQEFDEQKPLFSSETAEQHCKKPQRSFDATAQKLKMATEKVCSSGMAFVPAAPATTGSLR